LGPPPARLSDAGASAEENRHAARGRPRRGPGEVHRMPMDGPGAVIDPAPPLPAPEPAAPISPDALLRGRGYFALPSRALTAGRLVGKTLGGEPVVFARTPAGEVYALRDICPHRGIPLRHGRMVGAEVECPYHGWRFGANGACSLIPSLVEGQEMDL